MASGGIMGIFVGALLWLAGAPWAVTRKYQTGTGGTAALMRAAEKTRTPATINP